MSRWRITLVAFLITAPILVWAGVGTYYLWQIGWAFWVWWPLMSMVALGYVLAWYWQGKRLLLKPPDFDAPPEWTNRDREAFKLVEAKAKAGERESMERLGELEFYQQTAKELAQELASFYQPGSADPVDHLTIPEILAVIELASHDMSVLVEKHLPGGHLLTIRDWKRARQAQQWYQTGVNVWWTVSALFNPLQTASRYVASQLGIGTPLKMLQQNLFIWFYVAFVERLGTYLIELNSGRLRVGASRYRELVEQLQASKQRETSLLEKQVVGPLAPDSTESVGAITVSLVGQVKAGKSSLINALIGEERARTGVVPTTAGISRYELRTPGFPTKLILNDTVGYGHEGPREDQLRSTAEIAKNSDLLLQVLHARNPARQADLDFLKQLKAWFMARPDLKAPAILGVLTHVDLLSPTMEWNPPYDWIQGNRAKEISIREAVFTARQQLEDHLVGIVPTCLAPQQTYGIEEWLLPSMLQWLDEARGVSLLRTLRSEADREKIKRVFHQFMASGKVLLTRLRDSFNP